MSGPILALRQALLTRLTQDDDLAQAMGGTVHLYDEPPRAAPAIYAVFGDARVRDWPGDLQEAHEHEASIVIWARPGSRASALIVADQMAEALHDAALTLVDHRLVNLRVVSCEIGRDERSGLGRAVLRLRAVTERL
ncbi:MAG: DUF3168 domain-containing protein [Salinarimonas sp.]|nr:DUF3168 domain-containing protein [Salinarimonas sp.]